MKQDKQKTKVLFLIGMGWNDESKQFEKDLFALFPEQDFDNTGVYKTAYSHIGQHSCCHPDYAKECVKATQDQYNDLKIELESIGYNLEILN